MTTGFPISLRYSWNRCNGTRKSASFTARSSGGILAKTAVFPDHNSFDQASFPEGIDERFSGWIYHELLLDCWVLTSAALIRAEVFGKCGMYDESLPYSEDWDLWLRISHANTLSSS